MKKEIVTGVIAAIIPAGVNLSDVNDLLTASAALISIVFTVYRAVASKKEKQKTQDEKQDSTKK